MSEIRMCDNCGEIFSVNQRDWTEYTKRSDVHNAFNHGAMTMHMGPCCNVSDGVSVRPKVRALEAPVRDGE